MPEMSLASAVRTGDAVTVRVDGRIWEDMLVRRADNIGVYLDLGLAQRDGHGWRGDERGEAWAETGHYYYHVPLGCIRSHIPVDPVPGRITAGHLRVGDLITFNQDDLEGTFPVAYVTERHAFADVTGAEGNRGWTRGYDWEAPGRRYWEVSYRNISRVERRSGPVPVTPAAFRVGDMVRVNYGGSDLGECRVVEQREGGGDGYVVDLGTERRANCGWAGTYQTWAEYGHYYWNVTRSQCRLIAASEAREEKPVKLFKAVAVEIKERHVKPMNRTVEKAKAAFAFERMLKKTPKLYRAYYRLAKAQGLEADRFAARKQISPAFRGRVERVCVVRLNAYPDVFTEIPLEVGASRQALRDAVSRGLANLREQFRDKAGRSEYKTWRMTFKDGGERLSEFKRRLLEVRRRDLTRGKAPTTDDRYVGVELEFLTRISRSEVTDKLALAGLHKYATIKNDGSVNGSGLEGHEIALLARESEIEDVITRTCNTLREKCGATVNTTCGLHVHLDMRQYAEDQVKLIFGKLVRAHKHLVNMLPPSRRRNQYCRENPSPDMERNGDRYRMVNAEAYDKYRTIEVRSHNGTVDAGKIINWIRILIAARDASVRLRSPRTLKHTFKWLKLSDELQAYVIDRVKRFSPQHPEVVTPETATAVPCVLDDAAQDSMSPVQF